MTDDFSPLFPFLEMIGGYTAARVLTTAGKIGLFTPPYKSISPEAFSTRHHVSKKGIQLLLNALVALRIFEKEDHTYIIKEEIRRLFERFPELRWDLIHHDHLYNVWERLEEGIRTGHSPNPPGEDLARYPESLEIFLRAMRAHTRFLVPEVMSLLKWEGIYHLLDLGGGGAGFALSLVQRFEGLTVTLLDLPDATNLTKKIIADETGARRIILVPRNAYTDPLPEGPFDRILISHLIHIYPAEDNQQLVERAAYRLKSAGNLLLLDYFLDEEETGPREAVLFRLLMMIGTPRGDCFSLSTARKWLEHAGLTLEETFPLSRGNTLISARKP